MRVYHRLEVIQLRQLPHSSLKSCELDHESVLAIIGALTLCLMAFQVLVPTSFPVFNSIVELFGGYSSLAPPANQIEFYSKWQLWFAIGIALLSGTGQFFFWKKMDKEKLKSVMSIPVLVSLVLSAIICSVTKVYNWVYIITLTVGIYSIVSNTKILFDLFKSGSYKLTGGSIAHIGNKPFFPTLGAGWGILDLRV